MWIFKENISQIQSRFHRKNCQKMSDEEETDHSSRSNESSSSSDEEIIHDIPDKEFFKTLSCLKNKDPIIYDSNTQFFTEPPVIIKGPKKTDNSFKKVHLKSDNSEGEEEEEDDNKKINFSSPQNSNQKSTKFSLKDFDNDSSSEDELSAFTTDTGEKIPVEVPVENEYVEFLKGSKPDISDKEAESALKPLQKYWSQNELDENEKFLKDYILNKKYLSFGTNIKADDEDLSEDERELEEQAQYEANYNFRFENEENLKLKRFPRQVEGSLRRKDDSRSNKRAEIAQRKKEEKLKKQKEIKKKQTEKLKELEERLKKIKELTGNMELGFKDEEILEDFDPEKHDKRMNEMFNEDYYTQEDAENPEFQAEEEYFDNEEINMDCDADPAELKKNKLTRSQKKKLKKKKTYKDVIELSKPAFDPKVHNDFKKYIDEYYSLDCEDFIDDLPCKFKYREVVPNDYGLSVEEILMADDDELNRWASVKKITKRRPDHVEKNEVKIYKNKARNEYLKKKLLPSLFEDLEESVQKESELIDDVEKEPEEILEAANDLPVQKEASGIVNQGENSKKKRKRKKRKHSETDLNKSTSEEPHAKNLKPEGTINKTEQEINGGTENIINTQGVDPQKKKRKKKKKKKQSNSGPAETEGAVSNSSPTDHVKQPKNSSFGKSLNKKSENSKAFGMKNKLKNKSNFKKKTNSIVNLSDSRLQAYGIKPKQFRSKILYSQKNPS